MASRLLPCVALAALAAGCADPDVRVLDEPPPALPSGPTVPADQKKFRTLAAMVPADSTDGGWWFFKFSGPVAVVSKHEADFDRLFRTLRTTPSEADPVVWELPPGWTRAPGDKMGGMRFATLKSADGDAEVAVSRAGGHLLSNVQRWWGQLWGKDKEQELTAAQLPAVVATREVGGRVVLRVDLSGPNDPNAARPAMANPHGNPHGGK